MYRAKYLPVEGEIRLGDIVLETLTTGKKELFSIVNENDIDIKNQVRVKPFLITNNVTPGDEVFNMLDTTQEYKEWVLSKRQLSLMQHDGTIHAAYRKIGEIVFSRPIVDEEKLKFKEFYVVLVAGWSETILEEENLKDLIYYSNNKVKIK